MPRDLKQLESALRKIRIDFPLVLHENYAPAQVLQEVTGSEKKREEMEEIHEMLSTGMQVLIEENTELLKNSVVEYYKVHSALRDSLQDLESVEEKVTHMLQVLESRDIEEYLADLKRQDEKRKKDAKESLKKEMLSLDSLTIKDVYTGRLAQILAQIRHVEPETAREQIKKRTEAGVWKVKKEIEKKVKEKIEKGEELTQMEATTYRMVNGSIVDLLHALVQEALIEAINTASTKMKNEMHGPESVQGKQEREKLKEILADFTREVEAVLERAKEVILMGRNRKTAPFLSSYRHNAELYSEITLVEKENVSHTNISMPLFEERWKEENVLDLFVFWLSKFLKRLLGESAHVNEEEHLSYAIGRIGRTKESTRMYREKFLEKYRIEKTGESSPSAQGAGAVINVHELTTEEASMCVYGVSLVLTELLGAAYREIAPEKTQNAESLRESGVARCFARKRVVLFGRIAKANEKIKEMHGASHLEKYNEIIAEVLESLGGLAEMSSEGLERDIRVCAEAVLEKVKESLEDAFRAAAKVRETEYKNIRYLENENVSEEILKWNDPERADELGESMFASFSLQRFKAVSSFLMLSEKAAETVESIKRSTQARTRAGSAEEKEKIGVIGEEIAFLFGRAWGYFASHFLALAKVSLNQLVKTGDILDRRFVHFLGSNTALVERTAGVVQEFVCTYLFYNIERCEEMQKRFSFRYHVSVMQDRLERIREKSNKESVFDLESIFYALDAVGRGDRVYVDGLKALFQNSSISSRIENYCATMYKDEKREKS